MQRVISFTFFLALLFMGTASLAQDTILYKQVDTTNLYLELHQPENMDQNRSYPAIVFFFGGGWVGGSRSQFRPHAEYFAKRGLVVFLADYRVKNKHKTSPFDCLRDAKSAMRFVRKNAARFQVDPDKLIAAGGSAGGHLAVATALIRDYNATSDDLSVSCVPNALLLFNPVFDNGPGGYGYERIGAHYPFFSPLHNITSGAPPAIVFLGTEDRLIPVETAEYFKVAMEKVGSRCDLELYKKQGHAFFNYNKFKYYKKTVTAADEFLQSLGYLQAAPVIPIKRRAAQF